MNILFTLCGRAGSKGFQNKNLKMFLDIPLVYYSMAAIKLYLDCQDAKQHQIAVVLNTDSEDLKNIVWGQSMVSVDMIDREAALGEDSVPKVAVIRDCLNKMELRNNISFDMVVDFDITSPLRTLKNVQDIIKKKSERDDVDVVYSVTNARRNPYFNMVKQDGNYYSKAIASNYTARQQAPIFYDMNASLYAYSVVALRNKKESSFFNDRCDAIVMKDTAVLDIDSEEDFELMQVIARYLFEKDEEFRQVYKKAEEISIRV